jgi:integrase
MGDIRKRGNVWHVRYYDLDGKQREKSSGSTKREDAVRLLRQLEGDRARGIPVQLVADRLTFHEAAKDVERDYEVNGKRSRSDLGTRLKHLLPVFGRRTMVSITAADFRDYAARRLKEGAAPASVNRELAFARRAFVLAMQAGKLQARPHVPMLREDNVRQGFVDDVQFEAVVRQLPEDLRAVARVAKLTGWRLREVLGLTWKDIDPQRGEMRLDPRRSKNREGRVFPFTPDLAAIFREQRAKVHQVEKRLGKVIPHVFCWIDSTRSRIPGSPIKDFRASWKAACRAAGVPGLLFHDLRRVAVREFEQAGIPRSVAMKLTGHRSESVYRRYAIVSDADLRVAVERLAATRSRG